MTTIKIQPSGQSDSIIEFDLRLSEISPFIKNENTDDTIYIDAEEKYINDFKLLLETHQYDLDKVVVRKPLVSCEAKENMDEQSWQILKEYEIELDDDGNHRADQVEKWEKIAKVAFDFQIEKLQDLVVVILASPLYIGKNDEEIDAFYARLKLEKREIPTEEWKQAMEDPEIRPLMDLYNERLAAETKSKIDELAKEQFKDQNQNQNLNENQAPNLNQE